jgi:hypothetical protein
MKKLFRVSEEFARKNFSPLFSTRNLFAKMRAFSKNPEGAEAK